MAQAWAQSKPREQTVLFLITRLEGRIAGGTATFCAKQIRRRRVGADTPQGGLSRGLSLPMSVWGSRKRAAPHHQSDLT